MAISNSASPEIIWGIGGPEEDHQLHHCCWTGRVGEREEEEEEDNFNSSSSAFLIEIPNTVTIHKIIKITSRHSNDMYTN